MMTTGLVATLVAGSTGSSSADAPPDGAPATPGDAATFSLHVTTDPGLTARDRSVRTHHWTEDDDDVALGLSWYDGADDAGARADRVVADLYGEGVDREADPFLVTLGAPAGDWLTTGSFRSHPLGEDSAGALVEVADNCGTSSYTVREVDPQQDRLHAVFEVHCTGRRSSTFGEVRANVPDPYDGLSVAPLAVTWSPRYVDEPAAPVSVRVTNTGTVPQRFGGPRVSGDWGFAVVDSDCAVVAPTSSCAVAVGWTASAAGDQEGTLTLPREDGEPVVLPLTGTGYPGHNRLVVRATVGNDVLNGDFAVDPRRSPLSVFDAPLPLGGGGFDAPPFDGTFGTDGGPLRVGRFRNLGVVDDAVSAPGCEDPRGDYTVHEVAHDSSGDLTRLRLDFRQVCGDETDAVLHGELAWRSSLAVSPPPRVAVTTGPNPVDAAWRRVRFELEPGSGSRRVSIVTHRWDRPETRRVVDRVLLRPGARVERRIDPRGYELIYAVEHRGGEIVSDGVARR